MKSATESVRKAPKIRNFDVLYAFSVCQRCPNIWSTKEINSYSGAQKKSALSQRSYITTKKSFISIDGM
jgi:hypothetical protein